ncbi:hypothetical protein LPJ54_004342, partial [Coemansia sp. RSA 1824]
MRCLDFALVKNTRMQRSAGPMSVNCLYSAVDHRLEPSVPHLRTPLQINWPNAV